MNRATLDELARHWRHARYARDSFFALCVGCLILIPALLEDEPDRFSVAVVAAFGATLAILLAVGRPWRIDAARVVTHLDSTYPEMEQSTALFLKSPEQLALLERLQVQRIQSKLPVPSGRPLLEGAFGMPPRTFFDKVLFCLIAVLLGLVGAKLWRVRHPFEIVHHPHVVRVRSVDMATMPTVQTAPKIVGGSLQITPPAYTGLAQRRVSRLDAEIEEGASVTWTISLDRPVREARLIFGQGESGAQALVVQANGGDTELTATRRIAEAGLYHLEGTLTDGSAWKPPELFSLKVIKDRPPTLKIIQPADARTEVSPAVPPAPAPRVTVEVEAADDYGISDVRIIATVARGSGEAVKFREVPLEFDADPTAGENARSRRLTRTLDLGALGLEPGDELYFFVQCYDNRQPVANRTRSETRFVTLRGPEEKAVTTGQGVSGVNLVPQYFRSERQIIIDTEKLIADRPTINDAEFRDRANNLGIDQQLLRLRYGQLLGEEMEGGNSDHTEISLNPLERTAPEQAAGPRAAASITQRFLQEHEEQDREGGSDDERAAGNRPEHPDAPLAAAEIVAPFVDQHDAQDKSTYYDSKAKGTMRDALSMMWDAEKFLRTARPEEALAPENRALEILKDLQQSARAYVQHVGFEAPPIKIDQRRLKGDASDVPASGSVADELLPADPAAKAAREILANLPTAPNVNLGVKVIEALHQIEPALTAAATRHPDVFLAGLQALRRLGAAPAADARPTRDELNDLRRALLCLLPRVHALPERAGETDPELRKTYFSALKSEVAR